MNDFYNGIDTYTLYFNITFVTVESIITTIIIIIGVV